MNINLNQHISSFNRSSRWANIMLYCAKRAIAASIALLLITGLSVAEEASGEAPLALDSAEQNFEPAQSEQSETQKTSEPTTALDANQSAAPILTEDLPVSNNTAAPVKTGKPKYNDILTAVLRGDKEAVWQLLDMGRWVDKPGASGMTPLMAAVMNRDAEMVQFLLENGAQASPQALKLARKNKDTTTVLLLEQADAR